MRQCSRVERQLLPPTLHTRRSRLRSGSSSGLQSPHVKKKVSLPLSQEAGIDGVGLVGGDALRD